MRRQPGQPIVSWALITLLSLAYVFPLLVQAHGFVLSPPTRSVGPATVAACGALIASEIALDNTSHVEGLPELTVRKDSGYGGPEKCNLWLCRGLQFADFNSTRDGDGNDNPLKNVQGPWSPGQVVRMCVVITIPHQGTANVSIVDTRTNEMVPGGELLASWKSGYAGESDFYARTIPKDQTDFDITIPDLKGRCTKPGDCVSA